MIWRAMIRAQIRAFILNSLTADVVSDLATGGLTAADDAIIDLYLDQTATP